MSRRVSRAVLAAAVLALTSQLSAGTVLHVDDDAPGGDGLTWPNAFTYLQDALQAALDDPSVNEIRVAQGVYPPDRNSANPAGTGDREVSFQVVDGAWLRGGYAGFDAADPNLRDVALFETILSGDIDGNDGPAFADNEGNSYHVVRSGAGDIAIEGFVITAGNADGDPAAGDPPVSHRGAGMLAEGGTVSVRDCTFLANATGLAEFGGAAALLGIATDITVVDCRIIGNVALTAGNMNFIEETTAVVVNCFVSGNVAQRNPAMAWGPNVMIVAINSAFVHNTGSTRSPAIGGPAGTVFLYNCTVANNYAPIDSAIRIFRLNSTLIVENCAVWGNTNDAGNAFSAQIDAVGGATFDDITLNYSAVENYPGGLGIGNTDQDPRFADPDGLDGIPGNLDDNFRLFPGSPSIDTGDNDSVPADVTDLDGDGDFDEPTPLDLDFMDRFVDGDEDTVVDVDMGAYEFSPLSPGTSGLRLWTDPLGGAFTTAGNWDPALPTASDGAVFDLTDTFTVTFPQSVATDRLYVTNGTVTLDLGGLDYGIGADTGDAVLVGPFADQPAQLTITNGTLSSAGGRLGRSTDSVGRVAVTGNQSTWTLSGELLLGRGGTGELTVTDGGTVNGPAGAAGPGTGGIRIESHGVLAGDGSVAVDVTNLGIVDPAAADATSPATLTIDGDYAQGEGGAASGILRVDLAGATAPGVDYDHLAVTGSATLGGTLIVSLDPQFTPTSGESFTVVSAPVIDDLFDVALFPGLAGDLFMTVDYQSAESAGPGDDAVIVVSSLDVVFEGFNNEQPEAIGAASAVAVGDFDNENGPDLAILSPNGNQPGSVIVLFNAGVDNQGNWLGYAQGAAQLTVGPDPRAIDVGHLDGDGYLDIAVVNGGNDSASILINSGAGDGSFLPADEIPLLPLDDASAITIADFNVDGFTDFAVGGNAANNLPQVGQGIVTLYLNTGAAGSAEAVVGFTPGANLFLNGPVADMDSDDLDNDKDASADMALAMPPSNSMAMLINDGAGNFSITTVPVGQGPVEVVTEDVNADGFKDILTANNDGTVSMVLNEGGPPYSVNVASTANLPVGDAVKSLVAIDQESDGDLDIVVAVVVDGGQSTVTRVLRNDLAQGSQLVFAGQPQDLDTGPNPVLVTKADLDNNIAEDLIAVSQSAAGSEEGPGQGSVESLVNSECPVDFTPLNAPDGVVNGTDFNEVITQWGLAVAPGSPPDFDGDGVVGIRDLLILLANWGPCPGAAAVGGRPAGQS